MLLPKQSEQVLLYTVRIHPQMCPLLQFGEIISLRPFFPHFLYLKTRLESAHASQIFHTLCAQIIQSHSCAYCDIFTASSCSVLLRPTHEPLHETLMHVIGVQSDPRGIFTAFQKHCITGLFHCHEYGLRKWSESRLINTQMFERMNKQTSCSIDKCNFQKISISNNQKNQLICFIGTVWLRCH